MECLLLGRSGAPAKTLHGSLSVQDRGIQAIRTRLVTKESAPYYDPDLLVSTLLSLT
jgi:hypothetical protein